MVLLQRPSDKRTRENDLRIPTPSCDFAMFDTSEAEPDTKAAFDHAETHPTVNCTQV